MFIYTTCRDCGGLLHTTDQDTVHPGCAERPTRIEQLTQRWLAAAESGDDEQADRLQAQIDEHDNRPPRLREAALRYAGWGWHVFPLKPSSKQPATRHGFKDATTDTERIKAWWTRHSDHNIGLPTGIKFDVIDIDHPDGMPTMRDLIAQDRDIHGWVSTPSYGAHFYITATGRGNSARWLPGVDYRGKGGYVVAPPSICDKGRWAWLYTPSPKITGTGDTYGT